MEYADDPETGMQLDWNTTCYRLPFVKTADLAFDALLEEDWYRGISDAYWTAAATQVETDLVDEAWVVAPGMENGWRYALFVRDGRYIVTTFYSAYDNHAGSHHGSGRGPEADRGKGRRSRSCRRGCSRRRISGNPFQKLITFI